MKSLENLRRGSIDFKTYAHFNCGSRFEFHYVSCKKLYVSQPTISQAILEIERYYEIKVFDRISKKLFITEAGERLLGYARHIQSLFEEMENSILDIEKTGRIKIGASLTIGSCLLPKMVSKFSEKFPDVAVSAVIKNTKDIESMILNNEIDVGVVEGAVHASNITTIPFMEDDVVLVCGKSHPLFHRPQLSLEEIGLHQFILREQGSGTRELFESVLASKEGQCQVSWEAASSDVIKNAVIEGMGIGVISKLLVDKEIKEGTLKRIITEGMQFKRKFHVIYHVNKYVTRRANEFIEICRNVEK